MNLEAKLDAARARHQREIQNLLIEHRLVASLPADVPAPNQVVFLSDLPPDTKPDPPVFIWYRREVEEIGAYLKRFKLHSVGFNRFGILQPNEAPSKSDQAVDSAVVFDFWGNQTNISCRVRAWTMLDDTLVRLEFSPTTLPSSWAPKFDHQGKFVDAPIATFCPMKYVPVGNTRDSFRASYLAKFTR